MTFSTLAWVPIVLFVALVLGLMSYTVNALWTMFSEPTEADEDDEAEDNDEPCLPDGTPIYRSRMTRSERQQGMADRGCDTLEEARSER